MAYLYERVYVRMFESARVRQRQLTHVVQHGIDAAGNKLNDSALAIARRELEALEEFIGPLNIPSFEEGPS